MVMNKEELIKKNLKTEIELCGKTKTEIAKELGISKPTLSQYLSRRILPSFTTFAKICEIIDCSADDMLGLH
mgnify:FL=1